MEICVEELLEDEAQVPTEIVKEIGEIYNSGGIGTVSRWVKSAAGY